MKTVTNNKTSILTKLYKDLFSQLVNNELKESDIDLLGIEELSDIVLHDDILFILNHISP